MFAKGIEPELILHVGSPKTGSTAIQSIMIRNHYKLMENGIYFFREDFGTPSSTWGYDEWKWLVSDMDTSLPNIYNPVRKMMAIESNREFCERLKKEFLRSGCSKLIISEENLFRKNHNELLEILSVIKDVYIDFHIKVVCYLRRQDLFAESLFDQNVKWMKFFDLSSRKSLYVYKYVSELNLTGLLPEFTNFVSHNLVHMNYLFKVRLFEEIFGKKALSIHLYEKDALMNNSVTEDFFTNALCLPMGFYSLMNTDGILLNDIRLGKNLSIMKLKGNVFNQGLYADIAKGLGKKYKNINYFTDSTRTQFFEQFKESNEILAREFLGREDGILFRDPVELYDHLDNDSESFESDVLTVLMNSFHLNCVSGSYFRFNQFQLLIEQVLDYSVKQRKSVLLYGIRSRTAKPIISVVQRYEDYIELTVSDKLLLSKKVMIEGKVFNACQFDEIKDINPDYIIVLISENLLGQEVYNEIKSLELKNTLVFPCYDFSDTSWKTFMII